MTRKLLKTLSCAIGLAVIGGSFSAPQADARGGGRNVYIQSYDLDRPLHGYSGKAGNYYCDYQRHPKRVCTVSASGKETCAIKGWTLQQMCY